MEDLVGIDEFEAELSENFSVFVKGKPSDALGGGLYEMVITILHNELVHDALVFSGGLLTDTVTDFAKDQTKKFLANYIGTPIKNAFAKIKNLNPEKTPEIERVEVQFKDINFIIYNVCHDGISKNLDIILDLFESRINAFISEGQLPTCVYVPLFRDDKAQSTNWKQQPVFRMLEKVDETITDVRDDAYLNYWGLFYTFQEDQCRIYNVRTKEIFNAEISSLDYGTL